MTLDPELAGRSVCHVETVGRISGQPRRIEIWFAADPQRDRIYLLSGGRDRAHWIRNIRQNGSRVADMGCVRLHSDWGHSLVPNIDGFLSCGSRAASSVLQNGGFDPRVGEGPNNWNSGTWLSVGLLAAILTTFLQMMNAVLSALEPYSSSSGKSVSRRMRCRRPSGGPSRE